MWRVKTNVLERQTYVLKHKTHVLKRKTYVLKPHAASLNANSLLFIATTKSWRTSKKIADIFYFSALLTAEELFWAM